MKKIIEFLRLEVYFSIQGFYTNKVLFPIFQKLFPHIFVHKWGIDVYDDQGVDDSGYNRIRCANNSSWNPLGYFPNYYYYNPTQTDNINQSNKENI